MGRRKQFLGEVLSNNMQKTIVVRVKRMSKHPAYGRIVRKKKKFKAHDEKNTAQVGDLVRIEEVKPISKEKHFILKEVVEKVRVAGSGKKNEETV